MGFNLEDDLQGSSCPRSTDELKTILELLVPPHQKVAEEALDGLFERDPVGSQLVALEVVLEIPWVRAIRICPGLASESCSLRAAVEPKLTACGSKCQWTFALGASCDDAGSTRLGPDEGVDATGRLDRKS